MYAIGTHILIKFMSFVNSFIIGSAKIPMIIADKDINDTLDKIAVFAYFFNEFQYSAPFEYPTFTAAAFDMASGTMKETLVIVVIKLCAAA